MAGGSGLSREEKGARGDSQSPGAFDVAHPPAPSSPVWERKKWVDRFNSPPLRRTLHHLPVPSHGDYFGRRPELSPTLAIGRAGTATLYRRKQSPSAWGY